MTEFIVTDLASKQEAIRAINAHKGDFKLTITPKRGTRSLNQNNAAHLAFKLIADILNDSGLDQRHVLKEDIQIPWSQDSVKEMLFKPVMKAMTGKDSTTKLNKIELAEVYEVLMKHLGERFGIFIPFPHEEER